MAAPQGDYSDRVTHAELDCWLGGAAFRPPPVLYVGLSLAESYHLTGLVQEPSGGGYARAAVANTPANWPPAVKRVKRNGTAIAFPAPKGDWGLVRSWFVADHPTATSVLVSGTIPAPLQVYRGQPAPRFAPGALVLAK